MMATHDKDSKLTMYGCWRSSCTGRLRIAMYLKEIDFEYIAVDVLNDRQFDQEYVKISPSKSVPALAVTGKTTAITQSLAALEYLEEAYPKTMALMPQDVYDRAQVRSLINICAADIQPVTNGRVIKKIAAFGYDTKEWDREFHALGFDAFEAIIKATAGTYCFGDQITAADVCLAPAVWNAEHCNLDMGPYPTIRKVYENAKKNPAFERGHWKMAPDCPEELK